jgi:hypothetical protein
MKPHRVRMAHNLIVNYNLYKEMDIFVSGRPRVGGWCSPPGCAPAGLGGGPAAAPRGAARRSRSHAVRGGTAY